MAKGQKTGGRQKGAKNKATIERENGHAAIAAAAKAEGVTPLEVMLGAMREAWAAGDKDAAANFAKDAAPYVHPRLAAVDVKADIEATVEVSRIELIAPAIAGDDHPTH
jgi:hypothetical protein